MDFEEFYVRLVQQICLFLKDTKLDSVVSIMTGLRGSFLEKGNEFFSSPNLLDRL
jgi:hypothetical protein